MPDLMPVPAPAGGILSFDSPKESIQRKGDPDAALILCAVAFVRDCLKGPPSPCKQRDASLHRPFGLILPKPPVLGAA
jgi:hypothetical protein